MLAVAVSRAHRDSGVSGVRAEGNPRDHRAELPRIADGRDEAICPQAPGTWRARGQKGPSWEKARKSGAGSADSARNLGWSTLTSRNLHVLMSKRETTPLRVAGKIQSVDI